MGGTGQGSNFETQSDAYDFFGVYEEADSMYSDWLNSLNKQEKDAVYKYTTNFFEDLNTAHRQGMDMVDSLYHETIRSNTKALDSAIEKFVLDKAIQVIRGSSNDLIGGYTTAEEINENLKGAIVRDKGYMSTSAVKGSEFDGKVRYEITVPKGKGYGAFIDPLSVYAGIEHEFLLKRNSHFKVLGASNENGQLTVKLKVVNYKS